MTFLKTQLRRGQNADFVFSDGLRRTPFRRQTRYPKENPMTLAILLVLLGLAALALGLFGTVYPALPGLILMFAGSWLLGYADGYQTIGGGTIAAVGVLAAAGTAMDYVAGMLGAKFTGASRQALWGSFFGGIAGAFFGIPGLLLGPLLGAAAGEFLALRDALRAGKVGLGAFVGFIVGTAAKIGCAAAILLTLLGVWLYSLF